MSKREESRRCGLPHLGHSLGDARLRFRFFTTSLKFRTLSIGVLKAPLVCGMSSVVGLLHFYVVFWVT
jgi:hypothetical protein